MEKSEQAALQCENRIATKAAGRRRCTMPGVACWVTGEFGRLGKILCNGCIDRLRKLGWTVRYQLEGDRPADNVIEIGNGTTNH